MDNPEVNPLKDNNTQDNAAGQDEIRDNIPGNIVVGDHNFVVNSSASGTIVNISYSTPLEQPADIFISYARIDVETVRGIYETLLSKNHRPWMDVYSLKGGEDWLRAITNAIDECEIFLAILSNNSVSRRGVIQKELKKALDKWEGMLPDDIYIIPVRIDDCPIPDLLKHIQVLNWENGSGESKLLEAIRVGLARRKDG